MAFDNLSPLFVFYGDMYSNVHFLKIDSELKDLASKDTPSKEFPIFSLTACPGTIDHWDIVSLKGLKDSTLPPRTYLIFQNGCNSTNYLIPGVYKDGNYMNRFLAQTGLTSNGEARLPSRPVIDFTPEQYKIDFKNYGLRFTVG